MLGGGVSRGLAGTRIFIIYFILNFAFLRGWLLKQRRQKIVSIIRPFIP